MIFDWFNARDAAKIGTELADQFAPKQISTDSIPGKQPASREPHDGLKTILVRADAEVPKLRLNFYKKAKLANAFKWRLLENGVEPALADEVTQALLLHLGGIQPQSAPNDGADASTIDEPRSNDAKYLLAQGNTAAAQGDFAEAITIYRDLIRLDPRHVGALNNLGATFFKLGRLEEAESCFRQLIRVDPGSADGHSNLGTTFLATGQYAEAESFLRRALKLNPRHVGARTTLGLVLAYLSRLREAKSHFEKAIKYEPRNEDALVGMSLIAQTEGDFDQAAALLSRALRINPKLPKALASQANIRKMTPADSAWLESAEKALAEDDIAAMDESELGFAIGKYFDDIGNFKLAFQSYERANDILKLIAKPYDRDLCRGFVDDTIDAYPSEVLRRIHDGSSCSRVPVFIVGMPRSGTSLTEQILSSHPMAKGAGELAFWSDAAQEQKGIMTAGSLSESTRSGLAEAYLRVLKSHSSDALRVIDKAPINSDYLGMIHSVFPNARFIYMQRDPIDTCLSCYFQKFVLSMNFTFDLSDLAAHFRQHARLMAHWRATLPSGTLLDVPYEDLVADYEGWTRKILDFVGLEWDERVLEFTLTKRAVVTASFWQVRQRIYKSSVHRWRNYEKFIDPLLELKTSAR
jgi:tetratricopeptide (TPR) repeat protein